MTLNAPSFLDPTTRPQLGNNTVVSGIGERYPFHEVLPWCEIDSPNEKSIDRPKHRLHASKRRRVPTSQYKLILQKLYNSILYVFEV